MKGLKGFLEDIHEVGEFVNILFEMMYKDEVEKVSQILDKCKLWENISLMFWNLTNVTITHINPKDFIWSMIMIFGKFFGGAVDLPFLNTTMKCK